MSRLAPGAWTFFSLPAVIDPDRHRDYNAWHQLDHQPENLALPGVEHGDRWVRAPWCRRRGRAVEGLADVDYLAMYWFRDHDAIDDWRRLGTDTWHQGRRPDLAWTRRPLLGTLRAVEGHAAERTGVSAAAVPLRPMAGVHARIIALPAGESPDAQPLLAWERTQLRPRLLTSPGVAGRWTFRSERVRAPGVVADDEQLRIELVYVERDLDDVCDRVEALWAQAEERMAQAGARVLLHGPMERITPGQWDWFAEPTADGGSPGP